MSSINPHYTFEYSQPEDYRFSHDSVFLARMAYEECLKEVRLMLSGLDLCSGCGIVGLDFLFHLQKESQQRIASFDFVEIQEIYSEHFAKNIQKFRQHMALINNCQGDAETKTNLNFRGENYESLKGKYDLILCNPPYFRAGQGALSKSEFKNRCRFFLDSDFAQLIATIQSCLAPQGRCFLLLRNLMEHGLNPLREAQELLSKDFSLTQLSDIRGTGFVKIEKIC